MKVSTLKAKVKRIWVEVAGENEGDKAEKVWVDYRPGELTLEVSDELKEALDSGFESDVAFVMLRRVLVAWDLQAEDGSPLQVTDANLKTIPLEFLGKVLTAIEQDSRPNPQRGATSEGGSQQTELQDVSQNGTSLSEQQTGSLVAPGNS